MDLGIAKLSQWFKRYTGILVVLFIALAIWAVYSSKAEAAEIGLGLGAGATNDNGWIAQEITVRHGHWYGSILRTGDDDALPDTWRFAAGWRYDWRADKRVSPFIGFGAAWWADDITPLISDRLSYDMRLGLRFWDVVDLGWQHASTAGRARFNDGSDLVVLRLVFPVP